MFAALARPLRERSLRAKAAPFATVEVHAEAEAVDAAWAELERVAPCSIYQTRGFLRPWACTLGVHQKLQPRYVLVRDAGGRPVALLCLGLARHGPLVAAYLLGGTDANLQMALLHPDIAWTRRAIRDLLHATAPRIGVDLFVFTNQPGRYEGKNNPLATLPHVAGPSDAYGTMLPATTEALLTAKLSKDARKKLRRKTAKLAALGPVTHRVAREPDAIATILDALLKQKIARFQALHIRSDFALPAMRRFLEDAAGGETPGIEFHALFVGERVVATYGGAAHRGRWSGMVNSFDACDEVVARCSPGDLLLLRIVDDCCRRGLVHLDLGVGEARYKEALCDEPIPLFNAAIGFSPLGRLAAAFVLARQRLKRRVKRDPRLLAVVRRLLTLHRT